MTHIFNYTTLFKSYISGFQTATRPGIITQGLGKPYVDVTQSTNSECLLLQHFMALSNSPMVINVLVLSGSRTTDLWSSRWAPGKASTPNRVQRTAILAPFACENARPLWATLSPTYKMKTMLPISLSCQDKQWDGKCLSCNIVLSTQILKDMNC